LEKECSVLDLLAETMAFVMVSCSLSDLTELIDSPTADSGGPYVCNGRLTGVTSFGRTKDCSDRNYPPVFMDVHHFKEWIATGGGSLKTTSSFAAILLATFITKFIML